MVTASDEIRSWADQVQNVDLIVGVVSPAHQEIRMDFVQLLQQDLERLPGRRCALVIPQHPGKSESGGELAQKPQQIGSIDLGNGSSETSSPVLVVAPQLKLSSRSSTIRSIFEAAALAKAKACAVVDSGICSGSEDSIAALVRPVLDGTYDFIGACHAHRKFERTLTDSILYPMFRVLYGMRLRQPAAGEFCFSAALFDRFMSDSNLRAYGTGQKSDIWFATQACCAGARIGQVSLRPINHPLVDSSIDLSAQVAKSVGGLFAEMEKDAAVWGKVRGSTPIPMLGTGILKEGVPARVEPARLLKSFEIGFRNLQPLWSIVLTPTTMVGLRKLQRESPEQFRFPDSLWVRVVYDFAIGYHLRTVNREHLLQSLTPLYLAWLASHWMELESASSEEVEARMEKLCQEYESQKPYLNSRWRWPDRFNP